MRKVEIVTRIADETGLTKVQAEKAVILLCQLWLKKVSFYKTGG
jgi:hypothetical protein